MTGIELAQQVRQRFSQMPILLTSGYSDVLAEGGTHGFDLVQRPYAADALLSNIRQVLAARKAGD